MRPLPELTPANEWFWTSGADGTLRIQGCAECGELVHPPVPICPYCRSRSSKPTAVSGRGTIVGFTVNAHRWLPAFEPPYVIANVALAEDAAGPPDDQHRRLRPRPRCAIGQEVAVRFEQHEDVWLPLFELTGSVDPVDRVPEPVRPVPRAPLSADALRAPGRPQRHRPVEPRAPPHGRPSLPDRRRLPRGHRRRRAELEDIDGLSTYPGPGAGGMSEGGVTAVEEALRIHPTWHQRRRRPARAGRLGHCRRHGRRLRPLPPRALLPHRLGVHLRRAAARGQPGGGDAARRRVLGRVPGVARPVRRHVRRQLDRHATPTSTCTATAPPARCSGPIAVNERRHAALNPAAIYRDPMTMDDYLAARPITSPFGLYDCDVPCDGSIAVIVSDGVGGRRPPASGRAHRGRRAPRSSSGCRGTRAPSPTSPR